VPGEPPDSVVGEIETILAKVAEHDADVLASARAVFSREPFEVDPDEEIVRLVVRHAEAVVGAEPEIGGAPYWADSAVLAAAGIPTVLFGPGGTGAHAAVEWVDLAQTDECVETLVRVAAEFCGE